jgi:hypothetical protein
VTLAALRVLDHADDRTLADFLATDPDAPALDGAAGTPRSPSAGRKTAVASAVGSTSTDDATLAGAGGSDRAPDGAPQPGPTSAAQSAAAGKPPPR